MAGGRASVHMHRRFSVCQGGFDAVTVTYTLHGAAHRGPGVGGPRRRARRPAGAWVRCRNVLSTQRRVCGACNLWRVVCAGVRVGPSLVADDLPMRPLAGAVAVVFVEMAGTANGCSWEVFPNTNIIWGQVTGPAGGKATGCESGNNHPCWAAPQACPQCAPQPPHHTFVELGKAATFTDCMILGAKGWSDWPASAGEKPDHDCVTVGWGDDAATDGIPTYMNLMCYCAVSSFKLTKAGTMPIGAQGPVQDGQMAAVCHDPLGWTIVLTLGLFVGVYVGVGLITSARDKGVGVAQVRLHDHPHWGRWVDIASLAVDGVRATQARLRGSSRAGAIAATGNAGRSYGSMHDHSSTKKSKKKSNREEDMPEHTQPVLSSYTSETTPSGGSADTDTAGSAASTGSTAGATLAGDGGRWVRVPD